MTENVPSVDAEFTLLRQRFDGVKRRSSERYRCALATLGRLYFPADGTTIDAWANNLSEGGIGVNLDRALDVGTQVLVRLKGPSQRVALAISAEVIHSTAEIDGTWRIGCAFARRLTAEELEALL